MKKRINEIFIGLILLIIIIIATPIYLILSMIVWILTITMIVPLLYYLISGRNWIDDIFDLFFSN